MVSMGSNRWWSVVLACAMAMGSADALAKRIGGGGSMGKQSGNVTQRSSLPPTQATAPQPAATAAARPATPAAAAPSRPWGAMLGGMAAGLGLAWLASSLGFGEGFAQFLMIALLVVAAAVVIGLVMRRRNPAASTGGLAYQSASAAGKASPEPRTPRSYSPKNVGNDASARPWESSSTSFDGSSSGDSMIGSALGGSPSWGVPAGFDTEGFLSASKTNFIQLQDAWDRSDIPSLRAMMTDGMLEEIRSQLAEREKSGGINKTEVVMLEAHLLGIEEMPDAYMASVEFSGLIREDVSAGPNPFREVWNITRPKAGAGGWLVAGVQALQ
jgi:predicted lipid-binding transport protein (Tim44 family)